MKKIKIKDMSTENDFLKIEENGYKVYFSTAKNNRSFNRHTDEGLEHLKSIKKEFGLDKLIFIRQIHSDIIYEYKDSLDVQEFNELEGDAIITSSKNTGIGIFTADCVPVILADQKGKVVAAIHSGWKGTYKSITLKTVKKMIEDYGVNPSDINAYIGAHIRQCCYEVSNELKEKFIKEKDIDKEELFKKRNLNMECCIHKDLIDAGVFDENINSIDACTFCTTDVPLFSYRKSHGEYGRLFSFIVLK